VHDGHGVGAYQELAMTPEDWLIVNRAPFFRSVGKALTHSLLRQHVVRSYECGELVFQQGDPAVCFFLVLEGWIKLYRETPDGHEVVVSLFAAGESFAEAMIFRGGYYPGTAEAVSPVRLLHIDGQALRDAITRDPQISFEILAATALHLHRLVQQIEQLKGQPAPKRIANFLLSLTAVRKGSALLTLPYQKLLIANRLGMTPESFSRALRQLRSVGVAVDQKSIRIEDVARLARFVGDHNFMPVRCSIQSGTCNPYDPACARSVA
jgi:CRP-like cAMP-binding protein